MASVQGLNELTCEALCYCVIPHSLTDTMLKGTINPAGEGGWGGAAVVQNSMSSTCYGYSF